MGTTRGRALPTAASDRGLLPNRAGKVYAHKGGSLYGLRECRPQGARRGGSVRPWRGRQQLSTRRRWRRATALTAPARGAAASRRRWRAWRGRRPAWAAGSHAGPGPVGRGERRTVIHGMPGPPCASQARRQQCRQAGMSAAGRCSVPPCKTAALPLLPPTSSAGSWYFSCSTQSRGLGCRRRAVLQGKPVRGAGVGAQRREQRCRSGGGRQHAGEAVGRGAGEWQRGGRAGAARGVQAQRGAAGSGAGCKGRQ